MRIKESNKSNTVDFASLDFGDCFLYRNSDHPSQDGLLIKIEREQDAIRLSDGSEYENMCGIQVTPVNAEVQIVG